VIERLDVFGVPATNVHRGRIELVEETNGVLAAVTGEVAVVAVDHRQPRTQREVGLDHQLCSLPAGVPQGVRARRRTPAGRL
jgi:hypothetical protein